VVASIRAAAAAGTAATTGKNCANFFHQVVVGVAIPIAKNLYCVRSRLANECYVVVGF
jgi:hypothetical protein